MTTTNRGGDQSAAKTRTVVSGALIALAWLLAAGLTVTLAIVLPDGSAKEWLIATVIFWAGAYYATVHFGRAVR